MLKGCGQCGALGRNCSNCHNCSEHCRCGWQIDLFDADELGLDPETDNTPETGSRHA